MGCLLQHLREAVENERGYLAGLRIHLVVLAAPYLEFSDRDPQRLYKWIVDQPWIGIFAWFNSRGIIMLPREVQRRLIRDISVLFSAPANQETFFGTFGSQPHHYERMVSLFRSTFALTDPQ